MKKNTILFLGSILMIGGSFISCQKNEMPPKKKQASSLVTYNPCTPTSNPSTVPGSAVDSSSPMNPCSPMNPNSPSTPSKPYTPQTQPTPNQMNPSMNSSTPNYNSTPPSNPNANAYNPCSP